MEPLNASGPVVGPSAKMRAVFDAARLVADSDSTVVITGESGTGKEVTATLIHRMSRRKQRPFVPVSCTLFSEGLVESELFGHARGAFTGAIKDRPGRFEMAKGGTIFLDDIDDVPLSVQVKLLRVLQNRTVERVGGNRAIPVDVRVLAGSKQDLKKMVANGRFREDLYYRLAVLSIELPALRDRSEDIPTLMIHFLAAHFRHRGHPMPSVSPVVVEAFMRYAWPGNVRELENTCERIAQTCSCETLHLDCPSVSMFAETAAQPGSNVPPSAAPDDVGEVYLDDRLRALERSLLNWALAVCHGNQSKAAALLHVKRSTLGDRIRRCGLAEPTVAAKGASPQRGAQPSSRDAASESLSRTIA